MTLPSLVTANVPGDVQKRWDDFLDNVIVHESGHVKIGYDGAREYQHQLGNFPAMANCDVLKSQLQDLFQQNYRRIDQLNVEYDRTTRHGETQGAVFP
jgi:predicted secreted Zn-dependent protease